MNKLSVIQTKLHAPKGQYNKFGGYAYRSCEDILEALKPLLAELDCHLILKDEVLQIGDRYYVKAEASLYDGEKLLGSATGLAREEDERRGMSAGQLTGSCSSFARKYAVCGLVICDDNKDADALPPENYSPEQQKKDQERLALLKQNNLLNAKKFSGELQATMVKTINDEKFNSISGQENLAARIKEQLLKQTENLPPPPKKPTGAKDAHFNIGG